MRTLTVTAHPIMFAIRCCYVAISLACLTPPAAGQGSAATPVALAPIYRVGDTWTLVHTKPDTHEVTSTSEQKVVSVTERQITLTSSVTDGPSIEVDFDNQGNMIRYGSTTYEPGTGRLSFPMTVGKSWDSHHVQRFTSGTLDVSAHAEVVAYERIDVAAGSFDAYKIVSRGTNAKQLERLYSAPFTLTYWYAPSVKRIVKLDYRLYLNHQVLSETYEIGTFSLAP